MVRSMALVTRWTGSFFQETEAMASYLPGKRHAFQFQTLRFSARARACRDRRRSEALRPRWLVALEFSKFWGGVADAEKRLL
jgi:hypothetical protein